MRSRGLIGAPRSTTNWFLVYGSLFIQAETILVLVNVAAGIGLQAALLIVIASHNAFARLPRDPQLLVLALLPLIRLLSIAMPIPDATPIAAYALVGAPALIGAVLTARAIGLSPAQLGLRRPASLVAPALIAAIGLPLGLVARAVGGLSPMAIGDVHPLLFIAVVVPFVVLLEELVFRGLLQRVATTHSRLLGIVAPGILYAGMYFGSGSAATVVFMGLTGTLFSWVVSRSGFLWSVLGAHLIVRLLVQI